MRHTGRLAMAMAAVLMVAACSTPSSRSMLPRLRGLPSDERPPWLRDLPAQLERYPAPQHWGGDNLASNGGGARPGSAPA
jgi:hypothetical protein